MDANSRASLKLARVRRYGSHRVKVSLKNRVRSGLSEGLVLGLLKFDRDLRMARGHWPLTTARGLRLGLGRGHRPPATSRRTRAYSNLVMSLCWPTPIERGPQDFYNTRLGAPVQIWEE